MRQVFLGQFRGIPSKSLLLCKRCHIGIMLSLLLSIGVMPDVYAQDLLLGFAGSIGGSGTDLSQSVAVDSVGAVYVTGRFQGTVDMDPGPGVLTVTSAGDYDMFVYKLDAAGVLQWATTFGGTGRDAGLDIAVDDFGGVYLTGTYVGPVDFDPGAGVYELSNIGGFVLKLDATGNFHWVGNCGTEPNSLALDSSANVHVAGSFRGAADFDPGPGLAKLTSAGMNDSFVCKWDTSGTFQWVGAIGGSNIVLGTGISVDASGGVYITGPFTGTVDCDPGVGTSFLTSASGFETYISKLNATGAFQWAGAMGGVANSYGSAIAASSAGDVYVTGGFSATVDFDPGPGNFFLSHSGGNQDNFICKLDASGAFQWVRSLGGSGEEIGRGIALDSADNVYCAGLFSGTADFDPGPGVYSFTSVGWDHFVWKLDSAGALLWAGPMGGGRDGLLTGATGHAVAPGAAGNVYSIGWFKGTADFDPHSGVYNLRGAGGFDGFVLKLEPQSIPVATDDMGETDANIPLSRLSMPTNSSVLANDTDLNSLAALYVSAYDATSVLGARVTVNPDGTFNYDPTAVGALQAMSSGDSMTDSFTYTVSDSMDTAVATVTIIVYGPGTSLPATSMGTTVLLCLVLVLAAMWTQRRASSS